MKIAIITFHRAYNYGAVLQCYALYHTLEKLGHECYVLDYWPKYFYNQYYMHANFSLMHPPIKTWINHFKTKRVLAIRNQGFEDFLQNHLKLVPVEIRDECVEVKNKKFDLYITGSDQVWNDRCARFDRNYFLDFPCAKLSARASYAASFGMQQIPVNLKTEYRKRLSDFVAYSVRENEGKNILKDLLGVNASVNCDPTLLLDKGEWDHIAQNDKVDSEPYVLVYYVTLTEELQKKASDYAKTKGYKLVILPCNMSMDVLQGKRDRQFNPELHISASPTDFLALFKNACYIFTNSFHGTVFSLLNHKQFYSKIALGAQKRNHRVLNLLYQVGLISLDFDKDAFCTDDYINWSLVDKKIKDMRDEGWKYLLSIIEQKGID